MKYIAFGCIALSIMFAIIGFPLAVVLDMKILVLALIPSMIMLFIGRHIQERDA